MRIAGIKENDIVNGGGVCVSLFVQGCPLHCPGCFNPQTWDFEGGEEITLKNLISKISYFLTKNDIQRNFSILGGEPLCEENLANICQIIESMRFLFPDIKIFLWTGYVLESLLERNDYRIKEILKNIDVLIDGPFIEAKKDLTLPLRGSRNQRILTKEKINGIINYEK